MVILERITEKESGSEFEIPVNCWNQVQMKMMSGNKRM